MNGMVAWLLELEIHEGREGEFRALMVEMIEATKANEPGTLCYEWSTSADGRLCHVYERYADSPAVLAHLQSFDEKFATRFSEVLDPIRFVLYGSPSREVREALADSSPLYMKPAGGFNR